jgi:hypothetical protein
MEKVIIKIETVNSAFQNGNCSNELIRILEKMIFDLKNYDTFRDSYMDLNGNKVCSVTVE